MKKQEIKSVLRENQVLTTNVKTFLNTKGKKLLPGVSLEKVRKYALEVQIEKETKQYEDKKAAKVLKISVKEYRKLRDKASEILSHFSTGHSMGCFGKLLITNRKHKVMATKDTTKEYSSRCKYKATHGYFDVRLTLQELRRIKNIHGVWTIKSKGHKATWLASNGHKGSYTVERKDGYLFGESHGGTLEEAKGLFRKAYLAERAKRAAAKQKMDFARRKFIGLHHLKQVGACDPGINSFANRHGLSLDLGYRLDYLLELEPSNRFLNKLFEI